MKWIELNSQYFCCCCCCCYSPDVVCCTCVIKVKANGDIESYLFFSCVFIHSFFFIKINIIVWFGSFISFTWRVTFARERGWYYTHTTQVDEREEEVEWWKVILINNIVDSYTPLFVIWLSRTHIHTVLDLFFFSFWLSWSWRETRNRDGTSHFYFIIPLI